VTAAQVHGHGGGADTRSERRGRYTIEMEAAAAGGVLLCTGCGTCYVGGKHEGHLVSVHGVKGGQKRAVVEELAGVEVAGRVAEVVRQGHGKRRMDGLGFPRRLELQGRRLHGGED